MKQEYIESFLEIVKTLNITRASENLHITQSALSYRLKLLEEEMGMQLIMRFKGNRTLELTEHGEKFIEIAERWMMLYNETTKFIKNRDISLKIGSGDSLHSTVLNPIYLQISANDVPITLQIRMHNSYELYKLVENRAIDVALVSFKRDIKNVIVELAFKQHMCVAINCGNRENVNIEHPSQLDPSKEIQMNWGREFESWHNKWFGSNCSPLVETDSMTILSNYMNIENNWAILPVSAFDTILSNNPNIKICNLGDMSPPDRLCYIIKNDYIPKSHYKEVEIFERLLKDYINHHPSLISV